MDSSTVGTVRRAHFRIDGEDLTQLARDLFLEDQPNRAWRLIAQGLMGGDSLDAVARQVLDGDLKLVGNETDGIDAVPDTDSAEYKQRVRWLYAGRMRVCGTWYRPRAIVTQYGPGDAEWAFKHVGGLRDPGNELRINSVWVAGRTLAYGHTGDIVVVVRHKAGQFRVYDEGPDARASRMLWEPCAEPPHWWPELATPEAAFAAFEAAGRTLVCESYEKSHFKAEDDFARAPQLPRTAQPDVPAVPRLSPEDLHAALQRERDDAERQARAHRSLCAMWRKTILERNGGEMLDLTDVEGNVVATVPKRPFMAYALARTESKHLASWEPVCPQGLKLPGDSRAHTDWFVGMGGTLEDGYPYDSPLHRAATHTMFLVQEAVAGVSCSVLVPGPAVEGVVGQDVVVLPNLAPDHLPKLLTARAVITEQGGELAHLAQVALERSIPMVRMEDARTRFRPGMRVRVDATRGEVRSSTD